MPDPQGAYRRAVAGSGAFAFSPFILEWLAENRSPSHLSISAVCNCHCLFCSNDLNPFPIVSGFFRDIEDVKLQICAMKAHDNPIGLSASFPGRISEGEAFLHPRLFEILDLVRKKFFYNTLCFTTNASMLDAAFLRRLAAYRPIEIAVSLHSTQPEVWAKIFAKKEKDALTAIAALPLIKRYGMELAGSLVPLPRLCGWEDLERTYEYFVTNGAKNMFLYWLGYSVRTPETLVKDLAYPLDELAAFAQRMKGRFNTPLYHYPDMAQPFSVSVETIIANTLKGNPKTRAGAYQHVVWLASRAAFDRLQKMVAQKAALAVNRHEVVVVDNLTYKGNIIVAGLLMADDFINAGRGALERWPDADLFLLSAQAFDSLGRDLTGTPAHRIAESLGRPVWLVQSDGTIDSLLSMRLLKRRRPLDAGLQQAMDRFNFGRADDEKIESGLDTIAAYPVATSRGPLNRDQMREMIHDDRARTLGSTLTSRRFETLDQTHAVCLETWLLKNRQRSLHRWTRLVKKESNWLIEFIEEGWSEHPYAAAL